ncbi:MAG: hypothetical protein IPJ32_21875 [Sphingobacteriaceae bacterium]|nr:hypothetical protein [Sphingobacteriaceae bacterium]
MIANGVNDLKKTEFYTKQLKTLGFTEKDVTIKTYPIRKFYSDVAGALTKSLVEADRAEFFIEAITKKNAAGVIYKLEGSIVFSRADVHGDEFGSYIAKFNNSWKVYHHNVTNFLPANQKYIVNPQTVVKLIHSGLTQGKIKPNFLSAPYEGYFNDVIRLDSINLSMMNLFQLRKQLLFSMECFMRSIHTDTAYITSIYSRTSISSEVTVEIINGEPEVTKCYFVNSGIEKMIFGGDRRIHAYDTLFGGIKWVGTEAILGKKKVISTNILNGKKLELFLENLAKTITSLNKSDTEQSIKKKIEPYIISEKLSALSKELYEKFQLGFLTKYEKDGSDFKIFWYPNTKSAKKSWKSSNNNTLQ